MRDNIFTRLGNAISPAMPEPEARDLSNIAQSSPEIVKIFGGLGDNSSSGVSVNLDTALGVPAIWGAINFLSGTLAGLPLNLYKRTKDGREKISNGIASIFHDAVNDEMSSFDWRKHFFDCVFTGGRGLSYIERNKAGRLVNIWPMTPSRTTIKRKGFKKVYIYKQDDGNEVEYEAKDVIDLAFYLNQDGIKHRSPIMANKEVVGKAIAEIRFGSKFFQNGGVPPFAVTGGFKSTSAIDRAGDDFESSVKKSAKLDRLALVLPTGLEIKSIGVDADKAQLVESQRFSVEQIARIYSIPPTFLQDLTNGTFSNTEQQDLHVTKHTIRRWVEQFEQELNLKVFGRNNNRQFLEFNLDGLLRGDFKTRMEGYGKAIQNAIMKPNEVRRKENLPDDPDGNNLMIQGATVSVSNQLALPLETNPKTKKAKKNEE